MANAWEQVDMIAAEALMHLEDALVITQLTATDKTADFLTKPNGYTVGDTVRIKTRPEYSVKEFTAGGNISVQDIRESKRSMSIEKHLDVSVEVGAKEKVLDLESFSEQVIQPAAWALAENCDQYVGTKILNAAGLYASNAVFGTQADMAAARKAATLQQLNPNRICLVDLDLEATLLAADYFATWAQRGPQGASAFNAGSMGNAMGMNFFSSINFPVDNHAAAGGFTGTTNGDPTAQGATANIIGSSALVYDGGTGTVNVGDRIAIAGVRRPLICATQTTGASGSIPLVDEITEVIPDDAAITIVGSGQTNLAARGAIFDDRSISFAMPLLDTPSDKVAATASNNGYTIRVVQGYDMTTKVETLSLDLLIGAEAYDPRRITLLREY